MGSSTQKSDVLPDGVVGGLASSKSGPSRFRQPTSVDELRQLGRKTFSENTQKKYAWAVNLYRKWWEQWVAMKGSCETQILWSNIDNLDNLSKGSFCHALACFIAEVKKLDGSEYPGDTLYQIAVSLQFFLESKGFAWKLIDDKEFLMFKNTLDNTMKQRARDCVGKCEPTAHISLEQEEKMWADGVLGESCLDQLWDTLLYLLGLNFALRGGGAGA